MATCLVTGGAGYIGGMTARLLLDHGHRLVILDDFSRGHRAALDPRATLEEGDIRDLDLVHRILMSHRPDCVLHFAALAYVGESFDQPERYFDINVRGTIGLLEAMVTHGIRSMVFSSSCTVYGEPDTLPITEILPLKEAVSPYGQSKLAVEQFLGWLHRTNRIRSVRLRYFNAAGAVPDHGEDHEPDDRGPDQGRIIHRQHDRNIGLLDGLRHANVKEGREESDRHWSDPLKVVQIC